VYSKEIPTKAMNIFSTISLHIFFEVGSHCTMCKEMQVIPVNWVMDKKRIIGKNGGPRRRRGTRG
jgi:hypothetical protein